MIYSNDLSHIINSVMGLTPDQAKGRIVLGDPPHPGCHPMFRIEKAFADCGKGESVIDGSCEYLFIRFTDLGTQEEPLVSPETWDLWVLTYGRRQDDWVIHIPVRSQPGDPVIPYPEAHQHRSKRNHRMLLPN